MKRIDYETKEAGETTKGRRFAILHALRLWSEVRDDVERLVDWGLATGS